MDSTRRCPICHGTGFANSEICTCITGKKTGNVSDLPEWFADIFGDIFKGAEGDLLRKPKP